MSAAAVLMILTSVGVYGYLTNSYQETAKSIYETQNKIVLIDKKKDIYLEQKFQIDTLVKQKSQRISSYDQLRLTQENSLNTQLSSKKGTKGLQRNIQSVDNSTQTLNKEISELNQKSIGLSDSIAKLEQEKLGLENSTFTSEIGPLLYLSRLTGAPMDMIVNWFILILVSVFDPLAVSLVIAANHLRHKENEFPPEDDDSPPPNNKEKIEEVIDVTSPTEKIKTQVESQITDAVTVAKKQKSKKIKKEKKDLVVKEEIGILEQDEIERAFYEEPTKPNFGYRRGISL
jgi:hypothetical protein